MNRELIIKRLSCVEGTAGSIVGTATWCALHAQHASQIVHVLLEQLADSSNSESRREAYVYVLHEWILTCAANATNELGKKMTISAITDQFPASIKAVLGASSSHALDGFRATIERAVQWWSSLNLFSPVWIQDMQHIIHSHSTSTSLSASTQVASSGSSGAGSADVPEAFSSAMRLLAKYTSSKELLLTLVADASSSPSAVQEAREETLRRLHAAANAMSNSSSQFTDAEMADITGGAQVGYELKSDDDVLASFF